MLLDTKSSVSATCAVHTYPFSTRIVDLRTTSVVKCVHALLYSLLSTDAIYQMHLGYHELRNMLSKFKEDREKRKMPPPSSVPSSVPSGRASSPLTPGGPPRSGGDRDYRGSRDEYRDRDRGGFERHGSSRYEYVLSCVEQAASDFRRRERRRERSRSPGRRRY